MARKLLPIALQVFARQAAFEEGACVDAGRGVRLKKHQIAVAVAAVGAEEVIEADLENLRRGGVAGDVAAEFPIGLVGAHDHRQGVPADDRSYALLELQIAAKRRLRLERNGVAVRRKRRQVGDDAELFRPLVQRFEDELGAAWADVARHRLQRLKPLRSLDGIGVDGFVDSFWVDGRGFIHGKGDPTWRQRDPRSLSGPAQNIFAEDFPRPRHFGIRRRKGGRCAATLPRRRTRGRKMERDCRRLPARPRRPIFWPRMARI